VKAISYRRPCEGYFLSSTVSAVRFANGWSLQDLVFSNRGNSNPWNCFLEGSVQNHDSPGYALPGGVEALSNGQYFVAEGDTAFMLDKICKALRLRGISCAPLEANDDA